MGLNRCHGGESASSKRTTHTCAKVSINRPVRGVMMSREASSESSGSSPSFFAKDTGELSLAQASTQLRRSSTVRRASTTSNKRDSIRDDSVLEANVARFERIASEGVPCERYRRSLDSTYRHSLESISEYKTKSSFSSCSLYHSREYSSVDSPSSDCGDYAVNSSSDVKESDKTISSVSSNYLSWIESVHSEYFGEPPAQANNDIVDIDNKVGEWNNFWLNYNSPQNRYLSSHYLCATEDKTGDELSDCKSTCSTQKEFIDKLPSEQIVLHIDEVMELLSCAQRISDVLHKSLKRSDEIDQSRNDSYYSQPYSHHTGSISEDVKRERSFSYMSDSQEKQKVVKPTPPPVSSEHSCINVLLNTGVADILKRVINKRREVVASDELPSTARSSFSDWSTSNK